MYQAMMLGAFTILMAVGQLLFKYGVGLSARVPGVTGILMLFSQPPVIGGLVAYAVATAIWLKVLQTTPLSKAYPVAALGFVIVPLCCVWLFGEVLSAMYLLGVIFIVAGVIVTTIR